MEQSKVGIEISLFPLPSEWKNEFKGVWYKDNRCASKKWLDERWKEYDRLFDMIYKNQRIAFEKKQAGLQQSQQVSDEKVLINALNDIVNWNDDLDAEWGDPGCRASNALEKYKQSKPLTPNE